jgi:hypothetical protein
MGSWRQTLVRALGGQHFTELELGLSRRLNSRSTRILVAPRALGACNLNPRSEAWSTHNLNYWRYISLGSRLALYRRPCLQMRASCRHPQTPCEVVDVSNGGWSCIHRAFLFLDSYYMGRFPGFSLPVLSGDSCKELVLAPERSKEPNVFDRVRMYLPDSEVKKRYRSTYQVIQKRGLN